MPHRPLIARYRWVMWPLVTATLVGSCVWLVATNAPAYQFLVRLYVDKDFLKQTVDTWGGLAPVIFIALQALQVVVAPIPGELTGILGGFLFGQWLGLIYSTIGLTLGSMAAFGVGRWFAAHYVRAMVSAETWSKLGFIVEAEGAILCFVIYLIPGFPKDIVCYLFALSPLPARTTSRYEAVYRRARASSSSRSARVSSIRYGLTLGIGDGTSAAQRAGAGPKTYAKICPHTYEIQY